jgi:proline iminopeptidase
MKRGDQFATLNGIKAWFTVRGTGPVCIFPTPGWGASSDLYFETLKPLERLFTIVYLDTRGCGRSARSLPEDAYRLEHFMNDLDELRQLLGERAVWVVGHSLGGLLAQTFAVQHPESCRGLILLNSTAAIDDDARADQDMRVKKRSGEPWFPSAYAALHSDVDIATDEEFRDYLRAILPFYFHDVARLEEAAFAGETYSIEAYTMMTVNQAELARGVLDRLEEVRVPTVIVVGDDDFICSPVQAARIHLRVKGSKLVVIEQAGHFPWLEQPEAFYAGLEDALEHVGAFTSQVSV